MKKLLLVLLTIVSISKSQSQQGFENNYPSSAPLAKSSATVILDSTRLPIVAMKLPFLLPANDPIPDTPKVSVKMAIIDNGYKGTIGIEKRGSISQAFWYQQKSYGYETRDINNLDSDAVILGMPKEHD